MQNFYISFIPPHTLFFFLCRITPPSYRSLFKPFEPAEALGPLRGMAVEAVLSFTHTMVSQGVTDPLRPIPCNMVGVIVGFSIALHIMVGVSILNIRNLVILLHGNAPIFHFK